MRVGKNKVKKNSEERKETIKEGRKERLVEKKMERTKMNEEDMIIEMGEARKSDR